MRARRTVSRRRSSAAGQALSQRLHRSRNLRVGMSVRRDTHRERLAAVDYKECRGCGKCVEACPKQLIKLIPYDADCWVGCMSVDKGAVTRSYCEVGCISCKLCEKTCENGAISVNDFVAFDRLRPNAQAVESASRNARER